MGMSTNVVAFRDMDEGFWDDVCLKKDLSRLKKNPSSTLTKEEHRSKFKELRSREP